MTVLEARVEADRSAQLETIFSAARGRMPRQMRAMFLVRDQAEPTLWRGVSVWESAAALREYQASVATPGGVLMFREVGAEPTLRVFDVVVHAQRNSD